MTIHPPYVFQPYPSVRYHRSGATRIVQNTAEDAALGYDEWADTPAAFAESEAAEPAPVVATAPAAEEGEQAAAVEDSAAGPEPVAEPVAEPAAGILARAKKAKKG